MTTLTLTPKAHGTFTSGTLPVGPYVLDSDQVLGIDVGISAGSNLIRGLVSPNQYANSQAAVHRSVTAETGNGGARAQLWGGIYVYSPPAPAPPYVPTKANDNVGVIGIARSDVMGIREDTPGHIVGWFADALGVEGFGQIGGGAQYGGAWGALFNSQMVLNFTYTAVAITEGQTVITIPNPPGVQPLRDLIAAFPLATHPIYVGDRNADSIPDNTTVVSVDPVLDQFTISAPARVDSTANLVLCNTDGMLNGMEVSVSNYGSVVDSLLFPIQGFYPKWALNVGSRGTSPATGMLRTSPANVADNKANWYHGIYATNCILDFYKTEFPGRPGVVGFRMAVDNTDYVCDIITTLGVQAVSRHVASGPPAFVFAPTAIRVGMRVSGPGIPGNTYITAVSSDHLTLTLSRAVTDGSAVTLHFSDYAAATEIPRDVAHQAKDASNVLHDLIRYDSGTSAVTVGDVATALKFERSDAPDYTITNPVTLRTLDVTAGTLGDVRQVVGTLVADLISAGVLK